MASTKQNIKATGFYKRAIEQVIAAKRETATFLSGLCIKSYAIASGFALGELLRSMASRMLRLRSYIFQNG